ncbi:MAG: hypothetical protein M0R49_11295, partial [Limnochordia bacterium]|nr:hypothetical protein [Limnochordia bacterium]
MLKKRNALWLMLLFVFVLPALVNANGITSDMWGEIKAWDHSTQSVERMPWVYGNTLYYAKDYDIYSSTFEGGVWSEPQPIPGPINTG